MKMKRCDLKLDGVLAVRPSTETGGRFGVHQGSKHPEGCSFLEFLQTHMSKLADQTSELADSQKSSICRGVNLEVFIHLDACIGSLVPCISRSRHDLSLNHIWTPLPEKGPNTRSVVYNKANDWMFGRCTYLCINQQTMLESP